MRSWHRYISHHDVVCATWTYKYTLHSPKAGSELNFTPPTPSYYEYITPPSWKISSSMTSPPPSWILPKGLRRHLESSLWDLEAILNPLFFMLIDGGIPLLPMETPYTTITNDIYNIAGVLALCKSYWAAKNQIFIYTHPCVNKMTWAFFVHCLPVIKDFAHAFSCAYIELWMHLRSLESTQKARVALGCASSYS